MEFAHGPDKATKGMGTKSTDTVGMPLTHNCHRLQHDIGWPEFSRRFLGSPDPRPTCDAYWKAYPGRGKWEAANGA